MQPLMWQPVGLRECGLLHILGAGFPTWCPLGDEHQLTGWSGGPRAAQLATHSDDQILVCAVSALATALGPSLEQIQGQIAKPFVFNWQKDPLALAAFRYLGVGASDAGRQLGKPVADTLFCAGEATESALGQPL